MWIPSKENIIRFIEFFGYVNKKRRTKERPNAFSGSRLYIELREKWMTNEVGEQIPAGLEGFLRTGCRTDYQSAYFPFRSGAK